MSDCYSIELRNIDADIIVFYAYVLEKIRTNRALFIVNTDQNVLIRTLFSVCPHSLEKILVVTVKSKGEISRRLKLKILVEESKEASIVKVLFRETSILISFWHVEVRSNIEVCYFVLEVRLSTIVKYVVALFRIVIVDLHYFSRSINQYLKSKVEINCRLGVANFGCNSELITKSYHFLHPKVVLSINH